LVALQKISTFVAEIWAAVIEIAAMYIDPGEQLMALKFANFLQNYFRFNHKNHAMSNLSK
jgi:hypothetical protein